MHVACFHVVATHDSLGVCVFVQGWPSIRLDGSTAAGKRQKLVDKFNDPKNDEFVFLLSSKAYVI